MRRLTIDFVSEQFEKENYILLTDYYVNQNQKLSYVCPDGHHHVISYREWRMGNRCLYCAKLAKPTIEFINFEFAEEGYHLLTIIYINAKQKLDYICPNEHRHSISWDNWQQGCGCPHCSNVGKPTIEFIRYQFEKEKYVLLTKRYVNNRQKLDYVCPNSHRHSITWKGWQRGRRCPICAIINNSGENHCNWKGGISNGPYCPIWKDREFKEFIKQRDGYRCMNPYCNFDNPNDLVGHHIDYSKKNCDISNIITVCRSCNGGANKNREWHTAWYQAIMYMRYGYEYNEKGYI